MKYALIGCGRIADNHIKAAVHNKLKIAAVCDVIPEAMDRLLARHGLLQNSDIQKYADYRELIAGNPDIRLVSIAAESGVHAQIALYCIERGIHVIIEKPIAMSMADADMIIKKSEEKGVKAAACHQNRFNHAVLKMREALDAGRFGRISHGCVHVRWNRSRQYYEQASWRGKWATDGGALMNQCIHGIDLLRWMMGDRAVEVYGAVCRRCHDYIEAEDVGMAVVRFQSGAIATVEGTVNVFPENLEETLYLFGENGTVKLGGASTNNIDIWEFADENRYDKCLQGFQEETSNIYGNGHARLFADMIDAIEKDRKPYVDAVDGRNALELVLAIYKSQKTGKPVQLPLKNFACADMSGEFG